jgi:hypothetical protein
MMVFMSRMPWTLFGSVGFLSVTNFWWKFFLSHHLIHRKEQGAFSSMYVFLIYSVLFYNQDWRFK